jgi:putative aldouronate transport system permease protein
MYRVALGAEDNLYAVGQQNGTFANVLGGDLEALEPLSSDANNIQGIFVIRGNNSSLNAPILIAAVLFLLAAVLSFLPRVDRWFPLSASVLGALLLAVNSLSLLSVSAADMYSSASRQLLYLGVGHVTPVPLLCMLLGVSSAGAAALGVRRANEPYFVNPVPEGIRLRAVAVVLTAAALGCMLLPAVTVSFTQPGKNKVQATATIGGLDAVTFSAAERLKDPVTSKGKAVYGEGDGEYSAGAVNAATESVAQTYTWLTWAALILAAAALVTQVLRGNKRIAILVLLATAVLRTATWLCASRGLPRAVATGAGELWLYASIVLPVFAAFFTNFADREELPKKYKLFLMMLPFLLSVFLFAYLPLYGWSYAFYNYKFGLPMDQQEFVGLKWFAEMFQNPANRDNIFRVLKNTLGMSGLNLVTSWLPMIFAVFLNEITRTKFKKFVQIFTTLPNFISWALVFSFAMCLFAADTGIYSRLMMSLGLNDPANPTVWLNSGDHIWMKMWGWSTWKGLGWGAIMYLAAISGIDQELYEAAKVDGASRWGLMRHITLPGLLPTFFVLLMLSISNILNNGMDQYLVFQNPMNRQTIEVLDLYVYNITIASGGTALYSYATAIGILKTLVSVTLLFSANFLSKKLRGESIM